MESLAAPADLHSSAVCKSGHSFLSVKNTLLVGEHSHGIIEELRFACVASLLDHDVDSRPSSGVQYGTN